MDQSIDSGRRRGAIGPKHRPDLVDRLRDLGIVFYAESGIACRARLDVTHAYCDGLLCDAIHRGVSLLLQQVSKRGRATGVAISIATGSEGSIVIRVDVDEPDGAVAADIPQALRGRLSRLRGRLLELGVHLETHRDSPSALLVVPAQFVSVG